MHTKSNAKLILAALLALLPAVGAATPAATEAGDSATKKLNIIEKFIKYLDDANKPKPTKAFDFSILGGPSYSSDKGLGIGLVAAGQYRMDRADTLLQPSLVSLFGNITTKKSYKIGIEGVNLFPADKKRINYYVSFASYNSDFWGIGYEMGADDANKSDYKYLEVMAKADFVVKIANDLFAGPMVSVAYMQNRKTSNPDLWAALPKKTFSDGVGLTLKYDSRDFVSGPTKGVYLSLEQIFYPKFLGNKHAFSRTDVAASYYHSLWKGATGAAKFGGNFTYGNTPWGLLPTFGGSDDMRGYYEGQYRDKCAMTICAELRQYVWKRFGFVAWAGAGKVFPDFKEFKFNHILPNAGFGIRWEFKKHVNIRLDYGIGKHCSGVVFNINEAF